MLTGHGEMLETLTREVTGHGEMLIGHGEMLETLTREVTDHGEKLETLTREVETLGRETRAGWATLRDELLTELPAAAVVAVDRTFGAPVRELRADVDELKQAAG